MKINKQVFTYARIVLSIILLGTLVWMCNPAETWQVMRTASVTHLCAAFLLYLGSMFIVAFRWHVLLKARDVNIGIFRLTKYYFTGFFFNNFLPSSVGGDVTRIINVSMCHVPASLSFSTVFVERLIGFLAMAVLSIGSLIFLSGVFKSAPIVIFITVALTIVFIVITWSCFSTKAQSVISRLLLLLKWKGLGDKISRAYDAIHYFRNHGRALWIVFFVSLFYQFILGLFTYWVTRAAGLEAGFPVIFALMQITSMIGILPITLETAGTREWIYVLVLSPLGYDKSLVVGAMLLVRILSILASSLGGIFFLTGDRKKIKESQL